MRLFSRLVYQSEVMPIRSIGSQVIDVWRQASTIFTRTHYAKAIIDECNEVDSAYLGAKYVVSKLTWAYGSSMFDELEFVYVLNTVIKLKRWRNNLISFWIP